MNSLSGFFCLAVEVETLTLCPLIPGSPGVPGNPRAPCISNIEIFTQGILN